MTAPAGDRGRPAYDPFAPAAPAFPDARLRRAGLDDRTVDRLRGEYANMTPAEQREMARFVARHPDPAIADRFRGSRSRADLDAMTVDDLHALLRRRRLSTAGRKAELVDRLLRSYGGVAEERPTTAPQEAATAPPSEDNPTAPADTAGATTEEDTRG